jgi:SAM-dependent methyltransferase
MVFSLLRMGIDVTDDDFDNIYPGDVRENEPKHWTPVAVAKSAAQFLAPRSGIRVLDIGSGHGKFCMIGAATTRGYFVGVEQRKDLVDLAQRLSFKYGLANVKFIHSNITSIHFGQYRAFYFYNAFYENIDLLNRKNQAVGLHTELYDLYSMYLAKELATLPIGTKLATYCSPLSIVPQSFRLVDSVHNGNLNLWEKATR